MTYGEVAEGLFDGGDEPFKLCAAGHHQRQSCAALPGLGYAPLLRKQTTFLHCELITYIINLHF